MRDIDTRRFDFGDWEKIQDFNFTCPICDGDEVVEDDCPKCEAPGMVVCPDCDGEGCEYCDENGEVVCDECGASGIVMVACEHCENGWVVPIWNTAWEIELSDVPKGVRADILQTTNCTVFSDDGGVYYLGLTGCGMDLTPDLCKAWLKLGHGWLPTSWIYNVSRDRGYCEYVAGKEWTEKIYDVALKTLRYAILDAQRMINNIKGEQE